MLSTIVFGFALFFTVQWIGGYIAMVAKAIVNKSRATNESQSWLYVAIVLWSVLYYLNH